jgi:hypothetical protein
MIDQQQQIDHDEHAAVLAEQEAERASELAHEQVVADLANALGHLAEEQQRKALRLVEEGTLPTIRARGILGSSHLRYIHRASEVAHLAGRAALTVERCRTYALGAQVEALLVAHMDAASRVTSGDAAGAYEVAVYAAREVRKVAAKALAGTAEAAGLPGSSL